MLQRISLSILLLRVNGVVWCDIGVTAVFE